MLIEVSTGKVTPVNCTLFVCWNLRSVCVFCGKKLNSVVNVNTISEEMVKVLKLHFSTMNVFQNGLSTSSNKAGPIL